jgi:hypothetical protein
LDRSGLAVLEHILHRGDNAMLGIQSLNLKEVVSVCCWYLWWTWLQRTHN